MLLNINVLQSIFISMHLLVYYVIVKLGEVRLEGHNAWAEYFRGSITFRSPS